jgi:prolyl-tRNA synthetase
MRLSEYIVPTLKEDPADAAVSSHRLMVRAGLIRKEAAGMYAYLPLGLRALRKVMDIVREEMDKTGAMECLMPELTAADLWKESGRWERMGPEMFRITDRNTQEYALGADTRGGVYQPCAFGDHFVQRTSGQCISD